MNYIRYTYLEREFHKEAIKIVRCLAKNCIFEKSPKKIFFQICFNKGKKKKKKKPTILIDCC